MEQKLTLFELCQWIKDALSTAIPTSVWITAEISELKEHRNGHCYLELIEKDGHEITARARATIWSYTFRILKPYFETTTGQSFTAGIKVLVEVSVEYHAAYGLSLNIKDIDPAYTVGDMALHRRLIVERLKNEGVFDMNRELELPLVPQRIAVISAKTAAGFQDFINQLENNPFGFKFYTCLFEAYMQGSETVPSIISALDRIFEREDLFDAVAIIRGGGATSDLASLDSYDLAFYVTQFPLPVITGIGHEKDDTILDLVAHTRLKTPTAVAEFFISGAARFWEQINTLEDDVNQIVRLKLEARKVHLEEKAEKICRMTEIFIREKKGQLVKNGNKLHQQVNRFVFNKKYELHNFAHVTRSAFSVWKVERKNSLDQQTRTLKRVVPGVMLKKTSVFKNLEEQATKRPGRFLAKKLEMIERNETLVYLIKPENVLRRGYTITLKDGKIVKSKVSLGLDDEVETRFFDGTVKSKIIKKE